MKRLIPFIFIVTILTGCRSIAIKNAQEQINSVMNPLLGRSMNDAILTLGAPTDRQTIAGFEVLIYYRSYGYRASASYYNPYVQYAQLYGNTWEAYDLVRAYFQNDVLVKWDGYVQR